MASKNSTLEHSNWVPDRERDFVTMLLESLPGILYLYTSDGRFLRWNRSFELVSGYSAEEIGRLHPTDLFAPEHKPIVRERIARALDEGIAWVEAPFLHKNGSSTPYMFTGRRVLYEGKVCVVGMGIDISERVRAHEALKRSEERVRGTLDSILEACQLLDFDWRYLYLNETASLHNRRPNSELLGRTMLECWPGIEATPVFGMFKRCLEQRVPLHGEIDFTFPDGHLGWFDVRVQPVPEGMFILSIDITERKRAEIALRELNESLENKVEERTRELMLARERAESADRLKSAFLATMSHELRTPLNSIIGFSGILLQQLPGPLNPEQLKQMSMVQASGRHLLELINDVLDVSKIEAGQLEVRRAAFDLCASVERVVATVRPLAQKKGLTIHMELRQASIPLYSDHRRVEQVLLNLLNNAIKFTDSGSVRVIAECRASTVNVSVADTGIGIKPENLSLLFQPFRQIDSGLERQHEGTGLGLAICRRLSGLLGGSIEVTSEWGAGSVFTLSLPLDHALEAP